MIHLLAPASIRRLVMVIHGEATRTAEQAEAALTASERGIFQHRGRIIRVEAGRAFGANVAEIGAPALQEQLIEVAAFVRLGRQLGEPAPEWTGLAPCDPPVWIVAMMKARVRGNCSTLPPLPARLVRAADLGLAV